MALTSPPSDARSDDGSHPQPKFGDHIDSDIFGQILEMDDDEEDRDFSKSIVYDFFAQAKTTFDKMDECLETEDLAELSALGHFLKGSSATLGMTIFTETCEKIQHFGAYKDESGNRDEPRKDVCLAGCKKSIKDAKKEFKEVKVVMRHFFHDEDEEEEDDTSV